MSQDKECSNPGYENKFTCPACYTDFEGVSTTRCPGCATTLHCHRETQPVCVCTLGPAEEED